MYLLVGLGNPGPKHENDRHNMGFMAVDQLARQYSFGRWTKKFSSDICEGRIGGEKALCLKPQTFMNLSGQAVGEAARFYKLEASQIIVLYDELDLPLGKVRVKAGGGSGGHNGIKDIDRHIGAGYRKIRIGIGHPGDKERVTGHVLSGFACSEMQLRDAVLEAIADYCELLTKGCDSEFMSRVALALQQEKGNADGI